MIPVLKVSQMRQIDSDTIGDNVTLGYSYMLKAGMGLLNLARKWFRITGPVRSLLSVGKEITVVMDMWQVGC